MAAGNDKSADVRLKSLLAQSVIHAVKQEYKDTHQNVARPIWEPVDVRRERGLKIRNSLPRKSHAGWTALSNRPNPVDILREQEENRVPELLLIRYGRMRESPFAFFRGAAAIMARDLSSVPNTGIEAQLCGDCHLLNFGFYVSPERDLLFDITDFDETLPGPFEWDVKRLAASLVVAGRNNKFSGSDNRRAALAAVREYRTQMRKFAEYGNLAMWYERIEAKGILKDLKRMDPDKVVTKIIKKFHDKDPRGSLDDLTEVVDGRFRIKEDPPKVDRVDFEDRNLEGLKKRIYTDYDSYRRSLLFDRRQLLEQYDFVDLAQKVAGIGSVGLLCFLILLKGRNEQDPLILQLKQAEASVLEAYLGKSRFNNHGRRVVEGQRMMQSASDVFVGWFHEVSGGDFYCRKLRDIEGEVDVERMSSADSLVYYGSMCGHALARAHAKSGDRVEIAAYMGSNDSFDEAIADFAEAYADQTERDHQMLIKAIEKGKVQAEVGI